MSSDEQIKGDFYTVLFDSAKMRAEEIIDRFYQLEIENFGANGMSKESLIDDLNNSTNIFIFLYSNDLLIGVTHAKPISEAYEERGDNNDSAIIWNTIIDAKYRGRGLVGKLMNHLENELLNRGYNYIERFAAVANNYAANIMNHYGDRVIESYPHTSPLYGEQIFFRIKI